MKVKPLRVLIDANVLYSQYLRDLLLILGERTIYHPFWTDDIIGEWKRNLLKNRPDLAEQKINRTIRLMNAAFTNSTINQYEDLIPLLSLPDDGDRHVLAAAVKGEMDAILTFNVKDFPRSTMDAFAIQRFTPNEFFMYLYNQYQSLMEAFDYQLNSLRKPAMTRDGLMESLSRVGLNNAKYLFGQL